MNVNYPKYKCALEDAICLVERAEILLQASDDSLVSAAELFSLFKIALMLESNGESYGMAE